LFFFL
jgi:ubiquitin-protein ligase